MIPLNESHVQFLSQVPSPPIADANNDNNNNNNYEHPAKMALNDPASRFPQPRSQAPVIAREQLVRQFMILGDLLNAGTLLVDVRRTDYEGGTIRGSLNLPAQSFPLQMNTLFRLCAGDGLAVISRVVFYCGSSQGRGPRCAGWFQDFVLEQCQKNGPHAPVTPQVFVLEGGIKGWALAGEPFTQFMDIYVPSYWNQFSEQRTGTKRRELEIEIANGGQKRTRDDEAGQQDQQAPLQQDQSGMMF